ncbi:glycosyltransferase family 4 protein [Tsuneonella sp. HG249]
MTAERHPEPPARPRPVGYVLTHYPQLAQTFIAAEVDAVEQAGQPIRIFAMNPPGPTERDRPDAPRHIGRTTYLKPRISRGAIELLGFTVRRPLGLAKVWGAAIASAGGSPVRTARCLSHLAQAALLARHAMDHGIERLHAHFGLAPATIAWLASAIMRSCGRDASFSFTIHGFHDFVDPAESRLDIKAAQASAVVCISRYTLSQLCLVTEPWHWPKFTVVRCGVDSDAFEYRDPPEITGIPRLVSVGRLSAEKGFEILLEAVARLRLEGLAVELRIIGDGPARQRLATRISELGIENEVVLAGELMPIEVRRELDAADVFVMPSFSEGLPISLIEAMATGTPVVSTWIAGIPELARHGETALTVAPADAGELAQAIGRMIGDGQLRIRLARAARDRVSAQHDLRRSGEVISALLRQPGP